MIVVICIVVACSAIYYLLAGIIEVVVGLFGVLNGLLAGIGIGRPKVPRLMWRRSRGPGRYEWR